MAYLDFKFHDIKAAGDGRRFSGYASVFGVRDHGGDIVQRGAFARSLKEHQSEGRLPMMLWCHQPSQVPGKWTAMAEDGRGLACEGELLNTTLGRDTAELIKAKAVSGLSIGYRVRSDTYDRSGAHLLTDLDLAEVSLVALPMLEQARIASVKLHEIAEAVQTVSDFERLARDAFGLSRTVGKKFASRVWPHFREAVHGDPAVASIATLQEEMQSATVLALIHHATNQIRSIE